LIYNIYDIKEATVVKDHRVSRVYLTEKDRIAAGAVRDALQEKIFFRHLFFKILEDLEKIQE
jgi:hypothetical protein